MSGSLFSFFAYIKNKFLYEKYPILDSTEYKCYNDDKTERYSNAQAAQKTNISTLPILKQRQKFKAKIFKALPSETESKASIIMLGVDIVFKIFLEYISQSYTTLMLLAGLAIILIANRKTKIEGTQFVWAIMVLVFVLTSCEYLEYWCDTYNKPLWILYLKTALVYLIYPLIILLELYLVAQTKHKLLTAIPYAIYSGVVLLNLFGVPLIYSYSPSHSFAAGYLRMLPTAVVIFYLTLLTFCSPQFIKSGNHSKSMIVIFMTFATILTTFFELEQIAVKYTDEIAAIDIFIYYFYLAAIQHSKVQTELFKSELELEKSKQELQEYKIKLLVAQIQPHFIYNSLMALQSKSTDNPVVYEGIKSFGDYLRSNFTAMTNNEVIPFDEELKCIKAYLRLERLNFGDKMKVQYDIEINQFMLPALCIEPLVENAVRYGIGTYEQGGLVQIIVRDEPEYIEIEVKDDGSGGNKLTDAQKERKSIGLENVRLRLKASGMGTLSLSQDESGTSAVVRLKYLEDLE